MDFSTAFRFFTEDDTWKRKFGIAVLLTGIPAILGTLPAYFMGMNPELTPMMGLITLLALPILILASCITSGYSIDISRNVRDGEKHPLPEWSFGSQFKQGLTIFIAAFIYMVPFMILFMIVLVAIMAATIGGGGGIPGIMTFAPAFVISAISLSLLYFFMSALQVNYVRHNTFDSCFQFKSIKFIIQKRWKKLFLMMLLVGVVTLFTGGVSTLLASNPLGQLLFVGITGLTLTPFLTFVYGHLYGQIASLIDLDKLNAADGVA